MNFQKKVSSQDRNGYATLQSTKDDIISSAPALASLPMDASTQVPHSLQSGRCYSTTVILIFQEEEGRTLDSIAWAYAFPSLL